MTSGSVELQSGRWYWRVEQQARGATVVFRHRDRAADEMRTWIPVVDLMLTEAKENARDPVSRTWGDGFGARWRLRLMPAVRSSGDGLSPHRDDDMWLIFEGVCSQRRVLVAGDTRLGDLTHSDLCHLFASSS